MTEIHAVFLRWGPPRLLDTIWDTTLGSFQRTLYRLGIEAIDDRPLDDETALEEAMRAAAQPGAVVCVTATQTEGWVDRLDPLRRMMAKVSRKRMTLSETETALLPGGTERIVDPDGEIPLFLLPFSLPGAPRPTLLIITPGEKTVLEHLSPEIEKRIRQVFNLQGASRWVRTCGVGRGDLQRWIEESPPNTAVEIKPFPAIGGIDLLVRARDAASMEEVAASMQARWGISCYSWEGESLEEVIGKLLLERGQWLAIAESCTGGRIAARVARVPGASRYFDSACVTYSNRSKEALLGIPASLLQEKGAVSAEVAVAMAEGIRRSRGVDLGLSVTGIAGPGGGSAQKPVGLVYIALSDGRQKRVDRFLFKGDRETIQAESAQRALDRLRRHLLGLGGG